MSLLGTSAFFSARAEEEGEGSVNEGLLGALPLASVLLTAFSYHIGLGPIPWSYTGKKMVHAP